MGTKCPNSKSDEPAQRRGPSWVEGDKGPNLHRASTQGRSDALTVPGVEPGLSTSLKRVDPRAATPGSRYEPKEAQQHMSWKRTTVPDGIPGSPGPPPTADRMLASRRATRVGVALRVARELARSGARVHHRPT